MRTSRAFLLVFIVLFLCGFNFYSAAKNEQGNKLYKKGQLGKAKSAYEKALKADPASPEIAFNLGNAYYKEESYKDSLGSYTAAAKDEASPILQSKAFYNLGNGLFRSQELEKAAEFYKQALRLNPKDEDAKYNLELLTKRQNEQKKEDKKDEKKQEKQDKQDKQDEKDQKKDQQDQKQDQQQDKQDQKKDQQGQKDQKEGQQDQKEGQQDSKGSQGQEEKEQKPQDKSGQEQQPSEESQEGKEEKEEQGDQKPQESEGQGEKEEDKKEGQQTEQGKEQQKQPQSEQQKEQQGAGEGQEPQEESEGTEAEKPKTAEQIRAEQILEALENQEKQVFKMQSGQNQPMTRQKRLVDKDW